MRIHPSARKHGIDADDIAHGVRHALAVERIDAVRLLIIGPDRAGNLLELVMAVLEEEDGLVIHAMPLRNRYREVLRRHAR